MTDFWSETKFQKTLNDVQIVETAHQKLLSNEFLQTCFKIYEGGREGMQQEKNLERKEEWSLPPRMCFFLRNRSCVNAGRLFTQGQVLPALLPALSKTVGRIGPFSRTCLRHLTFRGSGTSRQKKKKWPKWKNTSKLQKKIQLSDEEIDNLSDAQFKILVIRMLTELIEFGHKLDEKIKTMLSDIKEIV